MAPDCITHADLINELRFSFHSYCLLAGVRIVRLFFFSYGFVGLDVVIYPRL